MIKQTFQVFEDEKVLIREEEFNKGGLLISSKETTGKFHSKKEYQYSTDKLLIAEVERSAGEVINKTTYAYDDQLRNINIKTYIRDELYEEVKTEFFELKSIRKIFQDNILAERFEVKEDGSCSLLEFYEDNKVFETHKYNKNNANNTGSTEIFDEEKQLIATKIEHFDSDNIILKFEEINKQGEQLLTIDYTYLNGQLTKEHTKDFFSFDGEEITTYEYDGNQNLIRRESRTNTDQLISVYHWAYNDNNEILNESVVSKERKEHFEYGYIYQ